MLPGVRLPARQTEAIKFVIVAYAPQVVCEQRSLRRAAPRRGSVGAPPSDGPARHRNRPSERLGDGCERDLLTARPISARAAAETSALDGNPIEHGNIQVFEPGGQSRAMGLRHHDLRMRDHGGERFDHGGSHCQASWGRALPA